MEKNTKGHLVALLTILIWGNTFVSTKTLLISFTPVEILFFRFTLGFLALTLAYPRMLKITERRQELYFIAAGLCGVTLYFLFENIALTYTFASNVGVLVAVTPFFTAILAYFFLGERLSVRFFLGFVIAIAGISLISFNGVSNLQLSPRGDILAILAAFVWAVYSVIVKKISAWGFNSIQTTRRIFFYGIVLMIPALFAFNFRLDLSRFTTTVNLINILFLGLGASALCFATWSYTVKVLGAAKSSIYIYMVPVVTVITAALILHERITPMAAAGTVLTLAGLLISEGRIGFLRYIMRKKMNGNIDV